MVGNRSGHKEEQTIGIRILLVALATSPAFCCAIWGQGQITGYILDSQDGQPILRSKASLIFVNDPDLKENFAIPPVTVATDPDGHYLFTPDLVALVKTKTVLLFAWAKDYSFSALRLDQDGLSGHYVFELQPLAEVSGRVRTVAGLPLAGAEVGVVYDDPVLEGAGARFGWQYEGTSTDGEGAFTTRVSAGYSCVVEAFHEDYLPSASPPMKSDSPSGGETLPPVDLRLDEGLTIAGRVIDESGRARNDTKIRLLAVSRRIPFSQSRAFVRKLNRLVDAAPDGSFVFKGVQRGDLDLIVTDLNGAALKRLELRESRSEIDLELSVPRPRPPGDR